MGSPLLPPAFLGTRSGELCAGAEISPNRTSSYPSSTAQYRIYYTRKMPEDTARIFKGEEIAYLTGCFRYESYGVTRESRFCFYWVSDATKNWKEWEMAFLPQRK